MSADEERLAADARKIERLLSDLQNMVGPPAWQRVEELVQTVTELYAAGLERTIEHALASGADEESLVGALCDDELAASLLVLHGLHPRPPRERIQQALAAARAQLGMDLEIADLDPHGVLVLRPQGSLPTCPSSRSALERTINDVVSQSAPEVTRVQILGGETPSSRLVQIGMGRAGGAT